MTGGAIIRDDINVNYIKNSEIKNFIKAKKGIIDGRFTYLKSRRKSKSRRKLKSRRKSKSKRRKQYKQN